MPKGENPNSLANLNNEKALQNRYKKGEKKTEEEKEAMREGWKRRTELKEKAQAWLDSPVGKDKNGKIITGADLMMQSCAKEIAKGNTKAMAFMRDTAGQKPVERVQVTERNEEAYNKLQEMVKESEKEWNENNSGF